MNPTHARWTETCTFCPTLCLHVCPVSNAQGRDTVTPWGKMSLARWLDRGVLPLDEDSARPLWACLGCLACHTPCRHDIDVPAVLFGARAASVEAGIRPHPAASFRPPRELPELLRRHAPADRFEEEAQALLLPGEDTLERAPQLVSDAFDAFDRLGIDWLAVGRASAFDSGYRLWAAGYVDEARRAAVTMAAAIARYRKVVVLSPHTLYMLTVVYPQLEVQVSPAVEWVGDLLYAALGARVLSAPLAGAVRYHDPCHLGRHLGRYDGPRRLLSAVCERSPGELRWSREAAHCCGAGGAVDITAPPTAGHAAETVVENAQGLGADVLATACAGCLEQLDHAARANGGGDGAPSVRHILTIVADALGRGDPKED